MQQNTLENNTSTSTSGYKPLFYYVADVPHLNAVFERRREFAHNYLNKEQEGRPLPYKLISMIRCKSEEHMYALWTNELASYSTLELRQPGEL